MSNLCFSSLNATFGVEVHGVDVSKSLDAKVMHRLALAYVEHKVLLLRGQKLTLEAYTRFARDWGEPRNDAFTDFNVPGFPDLSRVGNVGGLLEREMHRNGSCFWHTDCAAEENVDATTMLYCVHAPAKGGETHLADMQGAYDALDAATQARIDGLTARHSYPGTQPNIDGRENWEYPLALYEEETVRELPQGKVRPLVRHHSFTDRKGLYSPAGSIMAIDGLEPNEASRLVHTLKLHAVDERFCYRHKYLPGDILLWDNSATLHFASPVGEATTEADKRLLYRIVPVGLPKALARSGDSAPI